MKVIWKYPLKIKDSQVLELPRGSEVLTVQMYDDHPYLWAKVDPEAPKEQRFILMFATGDTLDDSRLLYLGTIQRRLLVSHVFEQVKE